MSHRSNSCLILILIVRASVHTTSIYRVFSPNNYSDHHSTCLQHWRHGPSWHPVEFSWIGEQSTLTAIYPTLSRRVPPASLNIAWTNSTIISIFSEELLAVDNSVLAVCCDICYGVDAISSVSRARGWRVQSAHVVRTVDIEEGLLLREPSEHGSEWPPIPNIKRVYSQFNVGLKVCYKFRKVKIYNLPSEPEIEVHCC